VYGGSDPPDDLWALAFPVRVNASDGLTTATSARHEPNSYAAPLSDLLMRRLSSFDVNRNFSRHGDAALREPVMITHYRRPRAVLLNVDLFRELLDAALSKKALHSGRLQQRLRSIATALDRKSKRRV
jgi:PHD/YefM family antitoxin component YafN of YafNO toxin-antitoxin module